MDDPEEGNPGRSLPSAGAHPRDGSIDFSQYSAAQLQELQYSIDRGAFPRNFENLLAELARRALADHPQSTSVPLVSGRFTARDGLQGWLQAKSIGLPIYGSGFVEVTSAQVALHGWQRTWLGVPVQTQRSYALNTVQNVTQDGAWVRFECKRRYRRPRRIEFHADSVELADGLKASLPVTQTAAFEKQSSEVREFNHRLMAMSPSAWVTSALVLLNLAVFVAEAISARRLGGFNVQQFSDWGANFAPLTVNGQWWRLIAALFIHLNLVHVALNMWALWNVGRLTERLYGRWVFLFLYGAAGIFGGLTSIAWDPARISAGASGAIFGIFGAFLAFLAHRRTQVPAAIVRAHWVSTLAFVLFNLVNGAMQAGIDNAAHVGGLLSGFVLGWITARPLAPESRARYPLRQCLIAMGLAAAGALAMIWQVSGVEAQLTIPQQYFKAHHWYTTGEADNLRLWQELAQRAGAGSISDAELGRRFEKEILPFWQSANERLKRESKSVPVAQSSFAMLVADFVRVRAEWAHAVIDATAGDAKRAQDAMELGHQSELNLARIVRVDLRDSMDRRARAPVNGPWQTTSAASYRWAEGAASCRPSRWDCGADRTMR
jgi:membrane associated rhomboid family serine protease